MPQHIDLIPHLPPRDREGHKGTFGTVMIIGGSLGMAGAAGLAGMAALRTGCGLVFVACPKEVQSTIASYEPSYLTLGLVADDSGILTKETRDQFYATLRKASAIAIGPGLGKSRLAQELTLELFNGSSKPVVLDADALNLIAEAKSDFQAANGVRILTPHPGEMSRLTGLSIAEIEKSREEIALDFAARQGCVLVLKGPHTVVTNGDDYYVNRTGNSGMATGGSGDVLTGVITSLLAQGLTPFAAAQLGVYLHGLAGDLAATRTGEHGVIASDLPLAVAEAIRQTQ
ncbi:MAG: NAD(P)H-hydrate dehydratase [Planctomycetaceae bacterium]|nr:NAD(P)H-hydrate dehydratase [Planctomycetaceae bacterium]